MTAILHWNLRSRIKDFRTEGKGTEARFYVLLHLVMSADLRLRCWPSVETIMKETGFTKTPVVEALGWLERAGAIYNVPREKRVGKEAKLHGNKKVWQLTGVMLLADEPIEFLLLKPENRATVIEEIRDTGLVDRIDLFVKLGLQDAPIQEDDLGLSDEPIADEIGLSSGHELGLPDDPEGITIGESDTNLGEDESPTPAAPESHSHNPNGGGVVEEKSDGDDSVIEMPVILEKIKPMSDEIKLRIVKTHGAPWVSRVADYTLNAANGVRNPVGFLLDELEHNRLGLRDLPNLRDFDYTQGGIVGGDLTDEERSERESRAPAPLVIEPVPDALLVIEPGGKMTRADSWKAAYSQLEIQLDRASFDTWLRGAQLIDWREGLFIVQARNAYARDMCQHRLYRNIRRVLSDCAGGGAVELNFVAQPVGEA